MHSSVVGHLNCFPFRAIKNRVTVFIQVCVSDEQKYIVLLGIGIRELADNLVCKCQEVVDLQDILIWGTRMDKFQLD